MHESQEMQPVPDSMYSTTIVSPVPMSHADRTSTSLMFPISYENTCMIFSQLRNSRDEFLRECIVNAREGKALCKGQLVHSNGSEFTHEYSTSRAPNLERILQYFNIDV